ncbi:MAG: hypothetical protein RIS06_981 [Actinomycetota bacterium]
MLSSHQVPVIVSVKKTTATKSLFAKILGLSAHIGILYIGTTKKLAWLYRTLDGTNGKETTLKVESLPRISIKT